MCFVTVIINAQSKFEIQIGYGFFLNQNCNKLIDLKDNFIRFIIEDEQNLQTRFYDISTGYHFNKNHGLHFGFGYFQNGRKLSGTLYYDD